MFCCGKKNHDSDTEVIYSPRTNQSIVRQKNAQTGRLVRRHSLKKSAYSKEVISNNDESNCAKSDAAKTSIHFRKEFTKASEETFEANSHPTKREESAKGWVSNNAAKNLSYNSEDIKAQKLRTASQLSSYPSYVSVSSCESDGPPATPSDTKQKSNAFKIPNENKRSAGDAVGVSFNYRQKSSYSKWKKSHSHSETNIIIKVEPPCQPMVKKLHSFKKK